MSISSSASEVFPLGKGLALFDLLTVCIWGIYRKRQRNKYDPVIQPFSILIKHITCYLLSSFIFWIFILLSETYFPGLVIENFQDCRVKWKQFSLGVWRPRPVLLQASWMILDRQFEWLLEPHLSSFVMQQYKARDYCTFRNLRLRDIKFRLSSSFDMTLIRDLS